MKIHKVQKSVVEGQGRYLWDSRTRRQTWKIAVRC